MYKYKKILVGLDFTKKDNDLIRYAGLVSKMSAAEKIYFTHIERKLELHQSVKEAFPELNDIHEDSEPSDVEKTLMKEAVQGQIDAYSDTKFEFIVKEGAVVNEIIRIVRDEDIDLVICGKERGRRRGKNYAEKVARKAPCSVLIVPEGNCPKFTKIIVPVDFSEHSVNAMDEAVVFATSAQIPEIKALHVYHIPIGYYKTGKTYENFAEIMLKNAKEFFHEFLGKCEAKNIKVTPIFILEKRTLKAIEESAEEENADLLVLGSKGRTNASAVMLGSVAEHVIHDMGIPILAVKKKGANCNIVCALLEL